MDIGHGFVNGFLNHMVDTPTPLSHPTQYSYSLLSLVLVLLVWACWVGRVTSGARCSLSLPPCAPRGGEVGVCPSGPLGLSEGL